jgi:hypothetical protein
MSSRAKAGALVAAGALAAFLLGSCGIETIGSYISGAPRYQSELIFKGTDLEESSLLYQGIDVFYKIYAREADADAEKADIQTKQANDIIPGNQVKIYLQNSLKYKRLKGNIPSLNRPGDPETLFVIQYSDGGTVNISGYSFARSSSTNKTFADRPMQEDDDYRHSDTPDAEGYLIQFYGCSYGTNFAGGDPDVYSDATYLGRVRVRYD